MSTTVHVKGIAQSTSDKEVRDFFSFCGKILNIEVKPDSEGADSSKSATVTFEKETAAKTALLLDNTQLGPSQVHVTAGTGSGSAAPAASSGGAQDDENLAQEDKPRSRIVAEYLAHGYTLSDTAIERAIALDNKHGISNRFMSTLKGFDEKYKATDTAKSIDNKYAISDRSYKGWLGLNSYFEKAIGTPTGQKLHSFYMQSDKQVRDIHNEARRLADLKSGKTSSTGTGGGASASTGTTDASGKFMPEKIQGTEKTVCKCASDEGKCGCAPGTCACSGCAKSDPSAEKEVKEAAQSAV